MEPLHRSLSHNEKSCWCPVKLTQFSCKNRIISHTIKIVCFPRYRMELASIFIILLVVKILHACFL